MRVKEKVTAIVLYLILSSGMLILGIQLSDYIKISKFTNDLEYVNNIVENVFSKIDLYDTYYYKEEYNNALQQLYKASKTTTLEDDIKCAIKLEEVVNIIQQKNEEEFQERLLRLKESRIHPSSVEHFISKIETENYKEVLKEMRNVLREYDKEHRKMNIEFLKGEEDSLKQEWYNHLGELFKINSETQVVIPNIHHYNYLEFIPGIYLGDLEIHYKDFNQNAKKIHIQFINSDKIKIDGVIFTPYNQGGKINEI